jgi:hypothetical protein
MSAPREPKLLLALACAVLALGLSACGGDSSSLSEKTLTFSEKDTMSLGFLDNPPKAKQGPQGPQSLSNADQLTRSFLILDAAKKTVGTVDSSCTVTNAGSGAFDEASAVCQGTFTLPGGQLFVSLGGKPFAPVTTHGAVTGGTGTYEGAIGSFTSEGANNSRDTFHIYIPKT